MCPYHELSSSKTSINITHCKKCWSHVGLHILVIETHYLDQVLKSCYLHRNIVTLGGLTHDLHDEMTLRLGKRERSENGVKGEGKRGGQSEVGRRERESEGIGSKSRQTNFFLKVSLGELQ